MIALVLSILADPTVIAVLAAIAGALGFGIHQRRAGAKAERAKQAADRLQTRTEADKIDDAVSGRSGDENRRRLGKWGRP